MPATNIFLTMLCFREDVSSGKMVEICDVRFEEACILYNIAALHSYLGCMDSRSNAEVCDKYIHTAY